MEYRARLKLCLCTTSYNSKFLLYYFYKTFYFIRLLFTEKMNIKTMQILQNFTLYLQWKTILPNYLFHWTLIGWLFMSAPIGNFYKFSSDPIKFLFRQVSPYLTTFFYLMLNMCFGICNLRIRTFHRISQNLNEILRTFHLYLLKPTVQQFYSCFNLHYCWKAMTRRNAKTIH